MNARFRVSQFCYAGDQLAVYHGGRLGALM